MMRFSLPSFCYDESDWLVRFTLFDTAVLIGQLACHEVLLLVKCDKLIFYICPPALAAMYIVHLNNENNICKVHNETEKS